MTPLKTNKGDLMAVEIPLDAYDLKIYYSRKGNRLYWVDSKLKSSNLILSDSKFDILGTYSNNEIDFEVEKDWVQSGGTSLVADLNKSVEHFKNYKGEHLNWFRSYKESFISLLQTQLDHSKRFLILKTK